MVAYHGNKLVKQLAADRIAEFHASIERMFLVVSHQLNQTLEGRGSDCKQTTFLFDATVFDFALGSVNSATTTSV